MRNAKNGLLAFYPTSMGGSDLLIPIGNARDGSDPFRHGYLAKKTLPPPTFLRQGKFGLDVEVPKRDCGTRIIRMRDRDAILRLLKALRGEIPISNALKNPFESRFVDRVPASLKGDIVHKRARTFESEGRHLEAEAFFRLTLKYFCFYEKDMLDKNLLSGYLLERRQVGQEYASFLRRLSRFDEANEIESQTQ